MFKAEGQQTADDYIVSPEAQSNSAFSPFSNLTRKYIGRYTNVFIHMNTYTLGYKYILSNIYE